MGHLRYELFMLAENEPITLELKGPEPRANITIPAGEHNEDEVGVIHSQQIEEISNKKFRHVTVYPWSSIHKITQVREDY